jgi:hypothetical protein
MRLRQLNSQSFGRFSDPIKRGEAHERLSPSVDSSTHVEAERSFLRRLWISESSTPNAFNTLK